MYQVLYRKYRPRVFSDVYGQEHITSTLKNEIKNSRVSHAYLFTGSRGTGKTTCAKILAKAVNCEHNANGEPCNECDVCKGIDNGSIYDVVEIDAASNNGVDNIRDLREEVNYTPTRGRYRVYIIDEVHMLSSGAFNALLKTLEEPPAHVIFILATTEVHKLPATILSRCQRFDFRRIQPETMAVRLKQVAGFEGLEIDDDAAILIARIADGALRDGLSILDQCAGRSKHIDSALVSQVAGLAGREAMYKLSDCIAGRDSNTAMSIISELYQNSFDMERLCVEMINHFRNFLVVKTVKKSRELIICTDDEYESIINSAKQFTIEGIISALDLFQNTLVTIKGGASARIEVEMALIKLCEPKMDGSIEAVLDRLSAVERAVKNGITATVKAVSTDSADRIKDKQESDINQVPVVENEAKPDVIDEPVVQQVEISVEKEEQPVSQPPVERASVEQGATHSADSNETVEFMQWGEFMDVLHKEDIALFGVLSGAKGYIRGDFFLIDSPNQAVSEFIKVKIHSQAIKRALYEVTSTKYRLGLFRNKTNDAIKKDPLEDLINQVQGSINVDIK